MTFTSYFGFMSDLSAHGAEAAAAHAAALGYSSVELLNSYTSPVPLPRLHPAEGLRSSLEAQGLTVACYSLYAHMLAKDEEALYSEFAEHVAYAAALGTPYMHYTLHPGPRTAESPSFDETLAAVLVRAATIADMARERGIICLFEPQGRYFNGVEGLGAFYRAIGARCPNVGICGDMGNSLFVDCEPAAVFRAFAPEIRHVHIKDYRILPDAAEGASQSQGGRYLMDAVPGEGDIDLAAAFRVLREVSYNGAVAFEFASDDEAVRRTMSYCRTLAEKA